jgi:hypothetical protein
MSDRIETYIYESPDGGGTIYRRTMGSLDRELIREGPLRKLQQRSQLWRDIFQAAESDPVLKDMLDRVEVYYTLKDSP